MTEQTKWLRKALEGCAERGISPTPEPWAGIEARLRVRGAVRTHRRRFVPRTRTGVALAAALVVLFGMGAYAASSMVYKDFRGELPGARGPVYGEQLDLVQTAHGVRVSLEWAYADSRNVVFGYNVEDLEGDRRVNGHPAEIGAGALEEFGTGKRRMDEELTDESGTDFDTNGGQSSTTGNLKPLTEMSNVTVFAPEKALEPGEHEFRLKVPIVARAVPRTKLNQSETVGEPFVFDFEIPVRPAPVIETNQTVEAEGIPITLKRVVNSPARPEAKICFNSPDTRYDWDIWGESFGDGKSGYGGGPMIRQRQACTTMLLPESLEDRSTVTVAKLVGVPDCPPGDDNGCSIPQSRVKTIEGPWTFEVTAPER